MTLTSLFSPVLNMSLTGSVVILFVLATRLFLKKAPKVFSYALWSVVLFRLLCPVSFSSMFSLFTIVEPPVISQQGNVSSVQYLPRETPRQVQIQEETLPAQQIHIPNTILPAEPQAAAEPEKTLLDYAAIVWAAGVAGMLIYSCISLLLLHRRLTGAVKLSRRIYMADHIPGPFVLGILRPKIFLPSQPAESEMAYILAHETCHIQRRDPVVRLLAYIALSLHWFNPLAWVAFRLSGKDMEMSCDEAVIRRFGPQVRSFYAESLLRLSTRHRSIALTPLAFGEGDTKGRIKNMANWKQPRFWVIITAAVVLIAALAACALNPGSSDGPSLEVTQPGTIEVRNVDELLGAIAPNADILMLPGTYNLCDASNYGQQSGSLYYHWVEDYDGFGLQLDSVHGLTIRGSGMDSTTLETEPRWANVITLDNCDNVTLSDFTAGHTKDKPGECSGGVLKLIDCRNTQMEGLGLFGCGVVGVNAESCRNLELKQCRIYECSSSAVDLYRCDTVTMDACTFDHIDGYGYNAYTYLTATQSSGVVVKNSLLSDSTLMYLVDSTDSGVELLNNTFRNNRIQNGAFNQNGYMLLKDDNTFTDNNIRNWYAPNCYWVVDETGTNLTEARLAKKFGTVQASDPTQPQKQVEVATVDELLAAIAPNTEIILTGELYEINKATGYGTVTGDYYCWEDIYDGPGLIIQNVDNLTIRSNDGNIKGHTISVTPRYANVLTFRACTNITVSGFTAGHTEAPGSCAGGVLNFTDSDGITVDSCGLFGCGILGVETNYCSDVKVLNSDIYDCSIGGIQMWSTKDVVIDNCTFRDLGGDDTNFIGCTNVTLDGKVLFPTEAAEITGLDWLKDITGTDELDAQNLEATVVRFTYAFFANDTETMGACMSEPLLKAWEATSYEGSTEGVQILEDSVVLYGPVGQVMEQNGYYYLSVPFTDSSKGNGTHYLNLSLVRENGGWKVDEYECEFHE